MAEDLTQDQADNLAAVKKLAFDNRRRMYPSLGGKLEVPLISHTRRDMFILDIVRGRVQRQKVSVQLRTQKTVILARLDLGIGGRHANPDGNVIGVPHLHLYRVGFADKWAFPVDPIGAQSIGFPAPKQHESTRDWFVSFCKFCNIDDRNIVDWGCEDLI